MLNLIVLRTAQMDAMLAFYRALGLNFIEEQHGKGPVHYACEIDSLVIEIYPAEGDKATPPQIKSDGTTMLGFRVDSVDAVITALTVEALSAPKDTRWGRRATLLDPDGRMIEISQPPAQP